MSKGVIVTHSHYEKNGNGLKQTKSMRNNGYLIKGYAMLLPDMLFFFFFHNTFERLVGMMVIAISRTKNH